VGKRGPQSLQMILIADVKFLLSNFCVKFGNMKNEKSMVRIPLWDLPIRIFHWLLVGSIIFSWLSAEWENFFAHYISGLFILTLLSFRFLWGFWGSSTARFSHFIKGMEAMREYMSGFAARRPSYTFGHNAIAALAVLALLLIVGTQVFTGLFASDDILFDGPLRDNVGKNVANFLGFFHEVNFNILLALIALHLVSQIFYFFWKKENLVAAMITGKAKVPSEIAIQAKEQGQARPGSLSTALLCYLPGLMAVLGIYFFNK